jgi:hypothetical protein
MLSFALMSWQWNLPFMFSDICPLRATFATHLLSLYLITVIAFSDQYKLQGTSLLIFLLPAVVFSSVSPNILFITRSQTLPVCLSLGVHTHKKTAGEIVVVC